MKRIDAVLPIVPRDFERFSLLARSLERFLADLGTLFVLVPATSAGSEELKRALARTQLPMELVPENAWLPGIDQLPVRGWYKQQLLKLAGSSFVGSDFYLTLDSDVICTRHCDYETLVPQGKARCFVMQQSDHQDWYDGAEAVLGLQPVRHQVLHNVTPVVWSRQGVRDTLQRVETRAAARQWSPGQRGLRQRVNSLLGKARNAPAWARYLSGATPWAEYATYFTYLEATGQFDRYHFEDGKCIYDVDRSLWKSTQSLEGWDPAPLFDGQGPPYFVVVQSNAHLPVAGLWRALAPWLGSSPGP